MKRYRVIRFQLDTQASILTLKIDEKWEENIKKQHRRNKEIVRSRLLNQFGLLNGGTKLKNFAELGVLFPSIIAFHNKFFTQIRYSFVISSYYPALTGVCALGERVLNHLILKLRDDYKTTPSYKKVYDKESFVNWKLAIETLVEWDVLLPNVAGNYLKLEEIRHKAIHFRPETEQNDRPLALNAIKLMSDIIHEQFSGFGTQPWFISGIPGKSFIKKEFESHPFIKKIYLPNCILVGHYHEVEFQNGLEVITDRNDYEDKEISDKEFAQLIKSKNR